MALLLQCFKDDSCTEPVYVNWNSVHALYTSGTEDDKYTVVETRNFPWDMNNEDSALELFYLDFDVFESQADLGQYLFNIPEG